MYKTAVCTLANCDIQGLTLHIKNSKNHNMQVVTGIEVNSEAYFPKLREYCPSAEGTRAIFPQLREIRHY